MNFDELFCMETQAMSGAFMVRLNVLHERAYAIFLGHKPDVDLVASYHMGGPRPRDVIGLSENVSMLINEKVRALLHERGFTGWRVVPISLQGKKGTPIDGPWWFLQVTGRCGPFDDSRSVLRTEPFSGGFRQLHRGAFFPDDSWDGSDIFSAPNNAMTIVTKKVKDAIEAAKISGVYFTSLTQMQTFPMRPISLDRPH